MAKPIGDVIDDLATTWLSNSGVVGISSEKHEGKLQIVFYVLPDQIPGNKIPTEVEGYHIAVQPSAGFTPL